LWYQALLVSDLASSPGFTGFDASLKSIEQKSGLHKPKIQTCDQKNQLGEFLLPGFELQVDLFSN
jgi:hypothetical protein